MLLGLSLSPHLTTALPVRSSRCPQRCCALISSPGQHQPPQAARTAARTSDPEVFHAEVVASSEHIVSGCLFQLLDGSHLEVSVQAQLNERLRRCASWEELSAQLCPNWGVLDFVNVSTAWTRLATIYGPSATAAGLPVAAAPPVQELGFRHFLARLIEVTAVQLRFFGVQALANVMWAMSHADWQLQQHEPAVGELVHEWCDAVCARVGELRPSDVSQICTAIGRLDSRWRPEFVVSFYRTVLHREELLDALDVSTLNNLLFGLSRARRRGLTHVGPTTRLRLGECVNRLLEQHPAAHPLLNPQSRRQPRPGPSGSAAEGSEAAGAGTGAKPGPARASGASEEDSRALRGQARLQHNGLQQLGAQPPGLWPAEASALESVHDYASGVGVGKGAGATGHLGLNGDGHGAGDGKAPGSSSSEPAASGPVVSPAAPASPSSTSATSPASASTPSAASAASPASAPSPHVANLVLRLVPWRSAQLLVNCHKLRLRLSTASYVVLMQLVTPIYSSSMGSSRSDADSSSTSSSNSNSESNGRGACTSSSSSMGSSSSGSDFSLSSSHGSSDNRSTSNGGASSSSGSSSTTTTTGSSASNNGSGTGGGSSAAAVAGRTTSVLDRWTLSYVVALVDAHVRVYAHLRPDLTHLLAYVEGRRGEATTSQLAMLAHAFGEMGYQFGAAFWATVFLRYLSASPGGSAEAGAAGGGGGAGAALASVDGPVTQAEALAAAAAVAAAAAALVPAALVAETAAVAAAAPAAAAAGSSAAQALGQGSQGLQVAQPSHALRSESAGAGSRLELVHPPRAALFDASDHGPHGRASAVGPPQASSPLVQHPHSEQQQQRPQHPRQLQRQEQQQQQTRPPQPRQEPLLEAPGLEAPHRASPQALRHLDPLLQFLQGDSSDHQHQAQSQAQWQARSQAQAQPQATPQRRWWQSTQEQSDDDAPWTPPPPRPAPLRWQPPAQPLLPPTSSSGLPATQPHDDLDDPATLHYVCWQAAKAGILPPRAFLRLYIERVPPWLRRQAGDAQLAQAVETLQLLRWVPRRELREALVSALDRRAHASRLPLRKLARWVRQQS